MPPLETELWVVAFASLAVATGLGYVAGVMQGRSEFERTLKKAGRRMGRLVDLLDRTLNDADRICTALNTLPASTLAPSRLERLEGRQRKLASLLSGFVESCRNAGTNRGASSGAPFQPNRRSKPKKFSVTWQREPVCERTGLPSRIAFEANLAAALEASSLSEATCGLLLVSIDKFDQLKSRIGSVGAEALYDQFSRVLTTSIRETDLVCRFNADTFAVLLPDTDLPAGREVSESLRTTIRSHRFHVDALGPEVLVTASFGYAILAPGDNVDLVMGRAGEALKRSRRRGRNQLHVHDGKGLDLCATVAA